jgi:tRNA (guanine9-N1)-methyltransferase
VKREREGEPGEEGFSSAVKRAKLMEQIKSSLPSSLSKSQQKKQAKLQYWKETKQEWKQKKKEKEKQRKKEKQSIKGDAANSTDRKITLRLMSSCESSPLRIAIELGYQDLMTEKVLFTSLSSSP